MGFRVFIEAAPKLFDPVAVHRDTGGMLVTAEAEEQVGHGFQGFEEMKRRNAAAGTLCEAVIGIASQDKNGALQLFYKAAGDDAEDAAVPVFRVIDQGRRTVFHSDAVTGLADSRFH